MKHKFVLAAKSWPTKQEMLPRVRWKYIELGFVNKYLLDFQRRRERFLDRQRENVEYARDMKRKHQLKYFVHAPYSNHMREGLLEDIADTYEIARQLDAELMVVHPMDSKFPLDNNNGIPLSVETAGICKANDIMAYAEANKMNGITVDIEHLYKASEPIVPTIHEVAPRLMHMHISDCRRGIFKRGSHLPLGQGTMGKELISSVLEELKHLGYAGAIVLEVREERNDYRVVYNLEKSDQYVHDRLEELGLS